MLCSLAPLPAVEDIGVSYFGQVYINARRWLESRKMRDFQDARIGVDETHKRIKLLLALEDSGIRQDERLAGLDIETQEDTFFETVVGILNERFPVEEELMINNYIEDSDFSIIPSPAGMNSVGLFDDIVTAFEDPNAYFSEDDSLRVFFKMLDMAWTGDDWETCNKYFGWNVPVPPSNQGDHLNSEKMERLLSESGMDVFWQALEVSCGSTNLFFEYNPYDGAWDSLEFTPENIRDLTNDWINAKEILKCEQQALEQCRKNPTLYQKFAYHWAASLEVDERIRVRV